MKSLFAYAGLITAIVAGPAASQGAGSAAGMTTTRRPAELPVKRALTPTTSAITAEDLMSRLYVFADDSMQGREAGTPGHVRGTEYIVRELTRLGLKPMGENGTFYQSVPLADIRLDVAQSTLVVNGAALVPGTDFHPFPGIQGLPMALVANETNAPIVFGGRLGAPDAIKPDDARGKLVVMLPPIGANGPAWQIFLMGEVLDSYASAAGLLVVAFELTPKQVWGALAESNMELQRSLGAVPHAVVAFVTKPAAAKLLGGMNPDSAAVGAGSATGSMTFGAVIPPAAPTRNVIAMIEGSDPALKGQMIALSAHSDHEGISGDVADHDSLRFANLIARPMGAESPARPLTAQERAKLTAQVDSVRRVRPARRDSISNGADDDGSGSMGLLEIAELFASQSEKPRRSILFVWNVAEEKGLFGSEWFTEHPTVPRDSIISNVNIDMIGRGAPHDIANGGNDYVQLLGSRRLSTEYGNWVEEVARRPEFAFRLDYQFDAPGHPQQYYCRSDHWNFARWSIPTVFFSTGSHVDYHMLTDEPQYIDYPHYAKVVQFVGAFAADVANRPERPKVDKPMPDPHGPCRQ